MDEKININEFKDECEGLAIDAVWWNIPSFYGQCDFYSRRNLFFKTINEFMDRGWLKLANHGVFLEGTIKEQIARFKDAFPKTEEEWKAKHKEVWFFLDECPGGAVWVLDDGYLDWT